MTHTQYLPTPAELIAKLCTEHDVLTLEEIDGDIEMYRINPDGNPEWVASLDADWTQAVDALHTLHPEFCWSMNTAGILTVCTAS